MMKAPDTTLMPGSVFTYWKAGRSTSPVGLFGSGHFAVGIAGLDHQRTQIERIDDQLLGLLGGQAFRSAQLQHQIDVLLLLRIVVGIDDLRAGDILEIQFGSQVMHLLGIADQDQLREAFAENPVGSLQVSLFLGLGQYDRLEIALAFCLIFSTNSIAIVIYSKVLNLVPR